MANKLFINGQEITGDVEDFKTFDIDFGLNPSTRTITKALSQKITVTGDTFEYFENQFFRSCKSYDKTIPVVFKSDVCAGIIVNLEITMEGMSYYPDVGKIDLLMKSVTDDDKAYAKLDTDYWFDNGFPSAYEIPIVYYADQPNWIQWAIIILTNAIRVIINIIDTIWSVVCKITVVLANLAGEVDCEKYDISSFVFGALDTWLTGLGRWGTAPLIREIISFQCQKAGISFSSSILNDPNSPYYNMGMFHLEMGARGSYKDTSTERREELLFENAPLMTTIDLLKRLIVPFEADYRIINGVLYFESEEFFFNMASKRLFHTKEKCTDPIQFKYNLEELFAWGEFKFTSDSMDSEGNKMLSYYNQKIDFNTPYSPAQKGKSPRTVNFGAARFMFDPISYDWSGFFDWEFSMDEFRDGADTAVGQWLFKNEGIIRKYDLILSGNSLSVPKLLIFEDDSNRNFNRSDALVIKKPYKKKGNKQCWLYNYPLLYKETLNQVDGDELIEGVPGELQQFAKLADPRAKKDKMIIDSIEIECDCDVINDVVSNFQEIYIETVKGKGVPGMAKIKFKENNIMIVLSSNKILCT